MKIPLLFALALTVGFAFSKPVASYIQPREINGLNAMTAKETEQGSKCTYGDVYLLRFILLFSPSSLTADLSLG